MQSVVELNGFHNKESEYALGKRNYIAVAFEEGEESDVCGGEI